MTGRTVFLGVGLPESGRRREIERRAWPRRQRCASVTESVGIGHQNRAKKIGEYLTPSYSMRIDSCKIRYRKYRLVGYRLSGAGVGNRPPAVRRATDGGRVCAVRQSRTLRACLRLSSTLSAPLFVILCDLRGRKEDSSSRPAFDPCDDWRLRMRCASRMRNVLAGSYRRFPRTFYWPIDDGLFID